MIFTEAHNSPYAMHPGGNKMYQDLRVGDKVFMKVSPWKKVLRFEQKGKLSSRLDTSHDVPVEEIEVRSDLLYEKESIVILDREVKVLRSKTVPLVKFLWRNHKTEKAT
ncbi:uncharacterized protein LOC108465351 [Gossypium arboreum]|uniref:uncharacterized protein LOC108465351 n=1 Tax=Gossypium arboreum TaxID=29729 RepID=UPI000819002F|nr:uncharacterized protein LOC108465351 [Gossypium arboreum]